jgi:hypothetical protein
VRGHIIERFADRLFETGLDAIGVQRESDPIISRELLSTNG